MFDANNYFHILPNCRITKGVKGSVVQNLTQSSYVWVPTVLIEIVEELIDKPMSSLKDVYSEEEIKLLSDYFKHLIDKGMGKISSTCPTWFSLTYTQDEWDFPFTIGSAIIDFNVTQKQYIRMAIEEIAFLGCHTLQLRFLNDESFTDIEEQLLFLDKISAFRGISIVCNLKSTGIDTENAIEEIVERFSFITEMILYNAGLDTFKRNERIMCSILFLKERITDQSCGCVQPFYFNSTLGHYTESLTHNTCLNRKIAIDQHGNIKNCPGTSISYGNTQQRNLRAVFQSDEFRAYWSITKDQIQVCSICEYRRMCTDCRAYIENPDDLFSKPLKCGYDPHECTWSHWRHLPQKFKATAFYQLTKR